MSSTDNEPLGEWCFEGVLQFLRSPLWNTPVQSFIDEYCGAFKPEEEENRLEYTVIHEKFRALVDELLSSFLAELGASPEKFMEAVKAGTCPELSEIITEYIVALDDFRSFRALMEKRNIEMELEAMYEAARMAHLAKSGGGSIADLDEQERFLLEMAIHMSLNEVDVIDKRSQKEDAELLQALAMSIAMEQERLLLERMKQQTHELARAIEEESKQNVERMKAEVHEKRVEIAQKAAEAIAQTPPTAPAAAARVATPLPRPAEHQVMPVQPPSQPVTTAAVPAPAPPTASSLDASASGTGFARGPGLAPVGERRSMAFGAKPLPFLSSKPVDSSAAPPPPAPAVQPSFQELKAAVAPPTAGAGQPSADQIAERERYLKAQRELLKAKKEQARKADLANYVAATTGTVTTPTTGGGSAASAPPATVTDDEQRQLRMAIARRFKEDILEETRKAAARGE